ncbi:MAG: hypothetical protein JSV34_06830, partial [Candidatus Omnitrophota bacterium]
KEAVRIQDSIGDNGEGYTLVGIKTLISNRAYLINTYWPDIREEYPFKYCVGGEYKDSNDHDYKGTWIQQIIIDMVEEPALYDGRLDYYYTDVYDVFDDDIDYNVKIERTFPLDMFSEHEHIDILGITIHNKGRIIREAGTALNLCHNAVRAGVTYTPGPLYLGHPNKPLAAFNREIVNIAERSIRIEKDGIVWRGEGEVRFKDVDKELSDPARSKVDELIYGVDDLIGVLHRRAEIVEYKPVGATETLMQLLERLYDFNCSDRPDLYVQLPAYLEEQILLEGVREEAVGLLLATETEIDNMPLVFTTVDEIYRFVSLLIEVKESGLLARIKDAWGIDEDVGYRGNSEPMPGVTSLDSKYPVNKSSYLRQVVEDYAFMMLMQWYWCADNYDRYISDGQGGVKLDIEKCDIPAEKYMDFARWEAVMDVQLTIIEDTQVPGLLDVILRNNNLKDVQYRGQELSVFARQVIADVARMVYEATNYYYENPTDGMDIDDYEEVDFPDEFVNADIATRLDMMKESYLYAEALNAELCKEYAAPTRALISGVWGISAYFAEVIDPVTGSGQLQLGIDRPYDIFIHNAVGGFNEAFDYEYRKNSEGGKLGYQAAAEKFVESFNQAVELISALADLDLEDKQFIKEVFDVDVDDGVTQEELAVLISEIIYAQLDYDFDGDGQLDYSHEYDKELFIETVKYMRVLLDELVKAGNGTALEL